MSSEQHKEQQPPKEYQCSWCQRNKFNGDESCPLDLEGTNGNSDIFDGVNRVIKSCGCGAFIDTHSRPAPASHPSAQQRIDAYAIQSPDGSLIIYTSLKTEADVMAHAVKIMAWDELMARGYRIVKVAIALLQAGEQHD